MSFLGDCISVAWLGPSLCIAWLAAVVLESCNYLMSVVIAKIMVDHNYTARLLIIHVKKTLRGCLKPCNIFFTGLMKKDSNPFYFKIEIQEFLYEFRF